MSSTAAVFQMLFYLIDTCYRKNAHHLRQFNKTPIEQWLESFTREHINGISKGKHTNKGETKVFNITILKNIFHLGCIININ